MNQVISWGIVTIDVSGRGNQTKNEEKHKDKLLVHV